MLTTSLPPELAEWAGIYRAMGRLGFSQAEVDEMELWVIAEHLGVHDEERQPSNVMTVAQHAATSADLLRQRVRAHERGTTPPAPPTTGPPGGMAITQEMLDALAERRADRMKGGTG